MIYLDNAATTQMFHSAIAESMDYECNKYGNSNSFHKFGKESNNAIEEAKQSVSCLVPCFSPQNILFTDGGTAANRMAIINAKVPPNGSVVVSATEHKSVLQAVQSLGVQVIKVYPNTKGIITAREVSECLQPNTALVSVMYVNNETGAVNDVYGINMLCKENNIKFHCDCVQAVEFMPIMQLNADFVTLSAHKMHGAKRVGCVCVRDDNIVYEMYNDPHNEYCMSYGTPNVSGIVSFGSASNILLRYKDYNDYSIESRFYHLVSLLEEIDGCYFNFDPRSDSFSKRILSVRFDGVDAETLLIALSKDGVYASAGAACNSQTKEPSYVLKACGLSDVEAMQTIRLSISSSTTTQDICDGVEIIKKNVKRLRNMQYNSNNNM